MYNSRLSQQVKQHLNGIDEIPIEYRSLFEAISASYDDFDSCQNHVKPSAQQRQLDAPTIAKTPKKKTAQSVAPFQHGVTEQDFKKALQKLDVMKNEFISSVSHELRTPLASIIGFAQTLQLDPDLPVETRNEFLQIIHDEGKRLAKLINDLLDLARIESGRIQLEKRQENLVALLKRALESVAMFADSKRITLTFETDVEELQTQLDPDRFTQMIVTVIGNAVKFTPQGGAVRVTAKTADKKIYISVADNGLGIPEEDLPHLFEKFYRVHRAGLDIRGTGLGLAIAKQLVELHGGNIHVESTENHGSTFTITLPQN